jgi:hypothetical protein
MTAKSAEAQLRNAVIAKLRAAGYPVRKNATTFPRVEVTDVTESATIDKGDDVRELGFIVEAISVNNYAEAAANSEGIEALLVGQKTVTMADFVAVDIYKELGTEIIEVGDADIIVVRRRTQYRANVSQK